MRELLKPFGFKPKPREESIYADVYTRAVAACLDVTWIFFLVAGISAWKMKQIYAYFGMADLGLQTPPSTTAELVDLMWAARYPWIIDNLLTVVLIGIPFVACQIFYGTTPGKWLMGIKVVRYQTHEPLTASRYILRFLAYIPATLPLMIGILWASFNKERRGWHDMMTDTVVLDLRPRGWYWNKVKQAYRAITKKHQSSAPMEQAVGEPTAAERHEDRSKPVE